MNSLAAVYIGKGDEQMKSYFVTIEEQVSQTFEVKAENEQEARKTAEEKYRKGEFVLEPGEVTARRMMVTEPNDAEEIWTDF